MSSARTKKSPPTPQNNLHLEEKNQVLLVKKGYSINPCCLENIQPLLPSMLLDNQRCAIFHLCDECIEENRKERGNAGDIRLRLCSICQAVNYAVRYGTRRDLFLPEGGKTGRQMTTAQASIKAKIVMFLLCENCKEQFAKQPMDDPAEFCVEMCNWCHSNQFISRFDMTQQLNYEKYLAANPGKKQRAY